MPVQPVGHHLNLAAQDVLTYASWGLTFVLLAVAVQMGRRERTPFYPLMVLAAMVGAFAEPLYDAAMSLYFYSTDGMFTHFTAFGIPQPVWTHSGYAVLYAAPAIFMASKIRRGTLTKSALFGWAGLELAMSCTFEMVGINGGTFTYWGPHELRIGNYPLVIGVLEAAQVMCFAVGAALLRERVSSPAGLLGLFVLFPVTFFGANFGAGAATIIAIHLDDPSSTLVVLASLVSIASAACLVRLVGTFLPASTTTRERAIRSVSEPGPALSVE